MTIAWPSRARAIPTSSESVVISLSENGAVIGTKTVARPTGDAPTSTYTFTAVPFGTATATMKAYPNADGTGAAQAIGTSTVTVTVTVTVANGAPGTLDVAMDSTISSLDVTATADTIAVGGTTTLTATAYDADGHVDPIDWKQNTLGITTLTKSGVTATIHGDAVGATGVTATLYPAYAHVEKDFLVTVSG